MWKLWIRFSLIFRRAGRRRSASISASFSPPRCPKAQADERSWSSSRRTKRPDDPKELWARGAMAMPYLARLTHPEVSHSTFLSRRKLLDQEREFSNQNVWLPNHSSNQDSRNDALPEPRTSRQISFAAERAGRSRRRVARRKTDQSSRKFTSMVVTVATAVPVGPRAALKRHVFTASMAFSSSPKPGLFTTDMFVACPSG